MPFVSIDDPRYTDVVLEEEENLASRQVITVNPTATGTYKQGTVLFRVKALDDSLAYDVVDAGADVALANEYAILIGDKTKPVESMTLTNGSPVSVIALVGQARVKETVVKAQHGTLSANNWRDLKGILRKQQFIRVEDSLTAV